MKQGRILGILFSAASVVLIVACVVMSLREDRSAPEFSYQETDVLYREGMDPSGLLRGVGAYDNRDGDVTGRIVVEKVIEDREGGSAIVFYVVSDLSGNAAKSSRVFEAVFDDIDTEEEEVSGGFPEAGIDAELGLSGGAVSMAEGQEGMETTEGDNGGTDGLPEEDGTDNGQGDMPDPAETPVADPATPSPEPAQTPAPTPKPVPTADPSAPILTLKVSEVRVKAGQGPAWVDIIGTLADDKDSYETLFHNLNVSKYDRGKAGSYGVNVYTEDSDGNRSQSVPLTIIVE